MGLKKKHLSEEEIAFYAEALKFKETGNIDHRLVSHIETCNECQLRVNEIYRLIIVDEKIIPSVKVYPNKAKWGFLNFPRIRIYIAAASILLVVFLIAILYHISKEKVAIEKWVVKENTIEKSKLQSSEKKDSITSKIISQNGSKVKDIALSQNYKAFPPLEGMLNADFRGGTEIVITAPFIEETLSKFKQVHFQWKVEKNTSLEITILNNKGNLVHSENNIVDHYNLKQLLTPGLYYWKLIKENEVIYVGKFLIR